MEWIIDLRTRWPLKSAWILMAAISSLVSRSPCLDDGVDEAATSVLFTELVVSFIEIASSVEVLARALGWGKLMSLCDVLGDFLRTKLTLFRGSLNVLRVFSFLEIDTWLLSISSARLACRIRLLVV